MLMPLSSNEINAFDEMIMVIKKIKTSLKAELLDDAGSTLSIQRERYIREEVIEYMLKSKKILQPMIEDKVKTEYLISEISK